jgi:glutamate-ammonia-ligase adenylyltransferase
LYEVDVRLRPSGRAGAVATSIESWREYQADEAWTWEHLALTRARVMAGDAGLADEVETCRRTILADKGKAAKVRPEVAEMRVRLSEAKPAKGAWEAKNGPGRLMDIELCAQMAALIAASPARQVERQMAAKGVVPVGDQAVLLEAYRLLWRLQCGARLLTDKPLDPGALGEGGRAFLLRETGEATVEALSARLDHAVSLAEAAIQRQFVAEG